ncbi:MAG: LysR family transcriptional regulator [Henriciella sp.]
MKTNWSGGKFDWNYARAFLVTLEEGSFSAAAKTLNLTQPTLSRQVAALEEELGLTLLERVGKGVEPTNSGLELLEHVRSMGDAADLFSLTASGQAAEIDGDICISCVDLTATFQLPSLIASLRKSHPGICFEIIASDRPSDLKRREADIAIRHFRPSEPDLIAKKLPSQVSTLYATPQLLEDFGDERTASDLAAADFIGFGYLQQDYIKGLNSVGIAVTPSNFKVICNNQSTHWEMTKQGAGIGVMPIHIGDDEPAVVRVLPENWVFEREVWLVAHRELRTNRRLRTVFDHFAANLK